MQSGLPDAYPIPGTAEQTVGWNRRIQQTSHCTCSWRAGPVVAGSCRVPECDRWWAVATTGQCWPSSIVPQEMPDGLFAQAHRNPKQFGIWRPPHIHPSLPKGVAGKIDSWADRSGSTRETGSRLPLLLGMQLLLPTSVQKWTSGF